MTSLSFQMKMPQMTTSFFFYKNLTNDELIFLEESITDDEIKSTDENLTDDEILFTDDTQTADETLSEVTLSADQMH